MTLPKMPRWTRPISKTAQKLFVRKVRDPQNVFVVIFDSIIFLISYAQAINKGLFDSVEKPLFEAIDNLPYSFHGMFYALKHFDGLTALFFWAAAAWYVVNKRVMFLNLLSGRLDWTLAKVVKASVQRGGPGAFIEQIKLFNGEKFNGYGFPSGHAAMSAACVAVLY